MDIKNVKLRDVNIAAKWTVRILLLVALLACIAYGNYLWYIGGHISKIDNPFIMLVTGIGDFMISAVIVAAIGYWIFSNDD